MESQTTKWENISADHMSDEGLVSRTYDELLQLNHKETNTQFKSGQRVSVHTSPKTYTWVASTWTGAWHHCHQRNANQNHVRHRFSCPLHMFFLFLLLIFLMPIWRLPSRIRQAQVLARLEKLGSSQITGGNVKRCSCPGKRGSSSET